MHVGGGLPTGAKVYQLIRGVLGSAPEGTAGMEDKPTGMKPTRFTLLWHTSLSGLFLLLFRFSLLIIKEKYFDKRTMCASYYWCRNQRNSCLRSLIRNFNNDKNLTKKLKCLRMYETFLKKIEN